MQYEYMCVRCISGRLFEKVSHKLNLESKYQVSAMDKELSFQKEVKSTQKGRCIDLQRPHCGSGSMKPDWVLGRNRQGNLLLHRIIISPKN